MGSKFTVEYWWSYEKDAAEGFNIYKNYVFWQGKNFAIALVKFYQAKKKYPNCVKITWR